jgi:hypothetical protein
MHVHSERWLSMNPVIRSRPVSWLGFEDEDEDEQEEDLQAAGT